MEEFLSAATLGGGRVPCFCYGSNGVEQIRSRVKNSSIQAHKAFVQEYSRIFCGYSRGWQGAVASLLKRPQTSAQSKPIICRGSVVYLTPEEFSRLDRFEGIRKGNDPFSTDPHHNVYARVWVRAFLPTSPGGDIFDADPVQAVAYIRNDHAWVDFPTVEYLAACTRNVRQFWSPTEDIIIRNGNGEIVDVAGVPDAMLNLRLFAIEVLAGNGKVPYFAYGAGSLPELRRRTKNPNLTCCAASAPGYQRIFGGVSKRWNGAVASLRRAENHSCQGVLFYLTAAELELIDRSQGIRSGSNPFETDPSINTYSRAWLVVHKKPLATPTVSSNVSVAPSAPETSCKALCYIHNDPTWTTDPTVEYLTTCVQNIRSVWPSFGQLVIRDRTGAIRRGGPATTIGPLASFYTQMVKKKRGRGKLTFIADKKFFDVVSNLGKRKGWSQIPFLRSNRYDLKWRNYANCQKDFAGKPKHAMLNHIEGSRCMGIKSEICWRLRAADLASASSEHPDAWNSNSCLQFYPQCWDLSQPSDLCCFVGNFTLTAIHAVIKGTSNVVAGPTEDVAQSVDLLHPSGVFHSIRKLVAACRSLKRPMDVLSLDPELLVDVLRWGTR